MKSTETKMNGKKFIGEAVITCGRTRDKHGREYLVIRCSDMGGLGDNIATISIPFSMVEGKEHRTFTRLIGDCD